MSKSTDFLFYCSDVPERRTVNVHFSSQSTTEGSLDIEKLSLNSLMRLPHPVNFITKEATTSPPGTVTGNARGTAHESGKIGPFPHVICK